MSKFELPEKDWTRSPNAAHPYIGVLDVQMPRLDGRAVAKENRNFKAVRCLPRFWQ